MKNDPNHYKDVAIFLSALVLIGVGFFAGTRYLKGGVTIQPQSGLLADVAANAPQPQDAATVPASSTDSAGMTVIQVGSATTSTAAVSSTTSDTIVYTSSDIAPPIVPFVSTPTSSSVSITSAPVPLETSASPSVALTLPYTETDFAGEKNWVTTWGTSTVDTGGFLDIGTAKNGTGFGIHLTNSASWTDYTFSANLNWVGGKSLSITARYHDDGDLVLCNYNEEAPGTYVISLQQYIKGKELTLAQSNPLPLNDAQNRPNTTISIKVSSVNGWCSLDNYVISNSHGGGAYLINAPYNGGIGFTMWDSTPNASQIILKNVNVVQD